MATRLGGDGAGRSNENAGPPGRRPRRAHGQALVEFAISLPVLGLILLGTLDMGQMFFEYIELRGAVREAAAFGARDPSNATGMVNAVYAYSPDLVNDTTVSIDVSQDPGTIQVYDEATVTVSATRTFTPLTLSFFQLFGLDSVTMHSSATARVWT